MVFSFDICCGIDCGQGCKKFLRVHKWSLPTSSDTIRIFLPMFSALRRVISNYSALLRMNTLEKKYAHFLLPKGESKEFERNMVFVYMCVYVVYVIGRFFLCK